MKISDNLLRTISHAYKVLTPTQFIIKADLIQFKDTATKLKALEVADMIARLTRNPTTETEKKFYKHTISVEEYNRELVEERKNNSEIETIKESILRNGLVYSPFLKYIYNALTKYEPAKIDLALLEDSLDKTHQKLTEIIGTNGKPAKKLTREEIETKLESLDSAADVLYRNIKEVTANAKENNDSISKIKETINTLKTLQLNKANTQDTLDIHQDLDTMYQNISKQIQDALENQANTLTEKIINQINNTSTYELQSSTVQKVGDKLEDMLKDVSGKIEDDISHMRTSITTKGELENILSTVQDLIEKADTLAEDPNLKELVEDIHMLSNAIDNIEVNNKAHTTAMEIDLDNIKGSLNIATTPLEMDLLLDNIEDYFDEPNQPIY